MSTEAASSRAMPSASGATNVSANFITLKEIGRGSFATVLLAEHVHTKKRYAVKRIPNPKIDEAEDPKEKRNLQRREELILREFGIWWELDPHPHIVPLVEAFRSKNSTYLIMELMEGGSLEDVLQFSIRKKSRVSEDKMRRWFCHMVSAVAYLHAKGIVHRDLKPANVLLSKDWETAKVADFGLAREAPGDEGAVLTRKIGSLAYMSAEVWVGAHDGFKADMWALGVTLYELLTTQLPFKGEGTILRNAVIRGEYPVPSFLSQEATSLIAALLASDPRARPSASEVADHPWMRGMLSSELLLQQQRKAAAEAAEAAAAATDAAAAVGNGDDVQVILPMDKKQHNTNAQQGEEDENAASGDKLGNAASWQENAADTADAVFDVPALRCGGEGEDGCAYRLINAEDVTRLMHAAVASYQSSSSAEQQQSNDGEDGSNNIKPPSALRNTHASSTIVSCQKGEDFALVAEFVSPVGICAARISGQFRGGSGMEGVTSVSIRRIRGRARMFREVVAGVQAALLSHA